MMKLPLKRSVATSLRNWANPRTIIFIFIFCLVILYVFWTTSGNSTSQFFQQENLINPIVTTTTTSSPTTTTTVKSLLLLSSLNKINENNYNNNKNNIESIIKGSYHMNFLPPPPQSPPKHYHINYLDPDPKEHKFPLKNNNNKILIKTETKGDNVAVDSMKYRKYIKNNKNIAGNINKPYGSTVVVAAKNLNHNNLKKSLSKTQIEAVVINDTMEICGESFDDIREYIQNRPQTEYNDLPIIYFVTPTYPRREQIPELTRLGQTLMHVPRIHWIVADDVVTCNKFLLQFLSKFGIPFTHISSPMPNTYRSKSPSPRGVANRRAALKWLRNNKKKSGVLYFGDDDNTFDLKLFSEIRDTKIVSMFPVGLIGLYAVSTPVVKDGKVIGFFDSWPAKRKWPVDMAGFAISLHYLAQHPNASMPYKAGYEEDAFLRSIALKLEDIEPKASNCTETLVWHTQTQKTKSPTVKLESRYLDYDLSSLGPLFHLLESMGVSHASESTGVKAQISKDGKSKSFSFFFR